MLGDWITKRLADRTFELKCPTMQLVITPDYTVSVFEGTGRVWFDGSGHMRFSMLCKLTPSELERKWLPRLHMLGLPPERYPEAATDYLQLRVRDLQGRDWTSNWLIPCASFPERSGYIEIYGGIESMSSFQKTPKAENTGRAEFVLLDKTQLPLTKMTETQTWQDGDLVRFSEGLNREVIEASGIRVHFEESPQNKSLRCTIVPTGGGQLLNNISLYVVQALRFMMSKPYHPAYYVQEWPDRQVIHIDGRIGDAPKSNLMPPFSPGDVKDYPAMWAIFASYLEYLLRNSNGIAHFHPISLEYAGVMQASKGSLEGFALALSVAVEGVLEICRKLSESEDSSHAKPNIEALVDHIKDWRGDDRLVERAVGAVRSFTGSSAVDKLRRLSELNVINEEYIARWKELRNKCAHGGAYIESDKLQIEALVKSATTLLHRIVLHEIGYNGPSTDYCRDEQPRQMRTGG
jgi:hypothetical protein